MRVSAAAEDDVEKGTTKKASLLFSDLDDDDANDLEEAWYGPLVRPNKGDASNFATFFIFVVGLVLRRVYGERLVLAFGLFGFAGGITNWLAVKMLFDRIPLLVGSGVVPRRFKDILAALKSMILDTFFEETFLKEYVNERSGDLLKTLDLKAKIEKSVAASPDFDSTLARKLEAISQTPDGIFLASIGPMFGGFDSMVPMIKPTMIALGVELVDSLARDFDVADYVDVASIRNEIDRALESRMTTLTPKKVKRMMSRVIREHLGWLVVWGNVFGGLIGVLSWLAKY
mmetsp:Transcript_4407/g.14599  ORF Transcript_4407/g.14599 Transcript_4407/m.14599 type:complete len:287 (-) Transcript_4407:7-867(-)